MSKNIKQVFNFLHKIENLKRTKRFKTVNDIDGDSVGDHTWRLALMTFVVAEKLKIDVDLLKSLKIALVHDLPESVTDDIDQKRKFLENISNEEKRVSEEKAMLEIIQDLPSDLGNELFDLWLEYEKDESREARFVKALDKIEGLMTHLELYNGKIDGHDLAGKHGNKEIKNFPDIAEFFKNFKEELKTEFKKHNLEWKKEYDDYT
jgi:putative hydrolase of HD superfamily